MKDILNLMRFDYITAKQSGSGPLIAALLLCSLLSWFLAPFCAVYLICAGFAFCTPVQKKADSAGLPKIYGILPVKRKNIARARFLYFWLIMFLVEILAIGIVLLSGVLKLNRFLPNQNSAAVQTIVEMNNQEEIWTFLGGVVIMFVFCTVVLLYVEMMGQIFGRENEMRILFLTLGIIAGVVFVFFWLSAHDILPMLSFDGEDNTDLQNIIYSVCANIGVLIAALLFGEITAHIVSKREL